MELLSIDQYAKHIGKSRRTIYNWIYQGKLKGKIVIIGKHRFIKK